MRRLVLLLGFSVAAVIGQPATAGECDSSMRCPNCKHVCRLAREKVMEKKHCWEVECKPICIPRVRFPWEKCCTPKCAKKKYVHVLKKVEFECPSCKHVWTPVCKSCCPSSKSNKAGDAKTQDNEVPVPPADGITSYFAPFIQSNRQ